MTTFNYMYNHLTAFSMEDYLLNTSFLLGNQGNQDQFPAAYPTSYGSITTSSSSCNSCIDEFDYMNSLLSTDMFTPVSTIVYDDGVSSSSSYPMAHNEAMSYLSFSTSAPTVCSKLYGEASIKVEYDEVNCLSPLQQQQLQPQDMEFYEESYFSQPQHFPNSPESIYSTDSHHVTIKQEAAVATDQIQQKEAQTQAMVPKKPAKSAVSATATTTTTTTPRPKTFACIHCNRTFARKYDAARHKRIHTGVKPYYCPCCNKGFARSDARVRHFRTEYNCRDGADTLTKSTVKSQSKLHSAHI